MDDGLPVLTICTDSFKPLATKVAEGLGVRDLPLTVIPHPLVGLTDEVFASRVAAAWPQVSAWLNSRLSTESAPAESQLVG